MDARGWEFSQSRRPSTKRTWDEEDPITHPRPDLWNGVTLPPIDSAPYRRPSMSLGLEPLSTSSSGYAIDRSDVVTKRLKHEGNDYGPSFRDDLSLNNGGTNQTRLQSPFPTPRGSLDLSGFSQHHRREWEGINGEAGDTPTPSASNLCFRCSKLTTRPLSSDLDLESNQEDGSNSLKNPEVVLVAQKAADELTKTLNTLSLGINSGRRGIIRHHNAENQPEDLSDSPPVAQQDLKQLLGWLLGRVCLVNEFAEKFVQHVQFPNLQELDNNSYRNGTNAQDDPHYSMKRHLDGDPDDRFRSMGHDGEPSTDSKLYTRRKSTMRIPNPDELTSMRSRHDYHPFQSTMDSSGRRHSIMNPPPAPNRPLPPSPGHSLPSPTSANFPSPSGGSYRSSSQSTSIPSHGHQVSSGTSYLPPIGSTHSSGSALQAHSAALQHEVSIQKLALSSLRNEHDKLLAAFSRSQTRASALEKKHSVSDNEIVNLAEEKIRLQGQVADLERDVEDLTTSRDEARKSAVREGVQYIEIVKKASRLEQLATEERKTWNTLRAEMERRLSLLGENNVIGATRSSGNSMVSPAIGIEGEAMDISSSSPIPVECQPPIKFESASPNQPRSIGLPVTSTSAQGLTKDLQDENRQLRSRCAEVEDTLRAVRVESRSVEGIVRALGMAGKSILEKMDQALGEEDTSPKE